MPRFLGVWRVVAVVAGAVLRCSSRRCSPSWAGLGGVLDGEAGRGAGMAGVLAR